MILIVDDEDNILELLEEYLGDFKKEIKKAQSVPEALKLLQSHSFQLVISDIVLDSGRGQSILSYMRKVGGAHLNTPVILISGLVGNPGELDSNTRFLAKPFSQEDLIATIKDLMPEKSQQPLHPTLKKILRKG